MQAVIPDALPDASVAPELARAWPARAPTLLAWLRAAPARVERVDPLADGCTPFEAWQLRRAGFRPEPGQPLAAGMGPLHAGPVPDDEPVWLAELAHVALGTDHAALLDPAALELDGHDGHALFEAVRPLFAGTGFDAEPLEPRRWRMRLPPGLQPPCATPEAAAGRPVGAWWPQDSALRPWRRLLNEIQMVWHEHPVNQARAERGRAPVNSLWLYGGARAWTPPAAAGPARVFGELSGPARAGDWHAWLQALETLDRDALRPLAGQAPDGLTLVLTGAGRLATLDIPQRGRPWRWLPRKNKDWNAWWTPPA